jgi:glycosyltransferase involved in cell wall biosynthesis
MLIGPLPPPVGGTTVSFERLVQELSDRDDVEVCVVDTTRKIDGFGRYFFALIAYVKTVWRMAWNVRHCDVVTLHASYGGTIAVGPVGALLASVLGKPFILREFGGLFDQEYNDASRLSRHLLRYVFGRSTVLLQTQSMVAFFSQRFPREQWVWFSNSRPRAHSVASKETRSSLKFIFIGHVKPTKGIREILAAAAALQNSEFQIDVYGPLMGGVSRDEIDGTPHVRYCGVLDASDVPTVLAGYDCLLLPSYHDGEGYPGVVLEAFMEGVPCVCARWRSIPEIVHDGENGLLVEPRSIDSLTHALKTLIETPQMVAELSRGASKASRLFDSTLWTERFVDICAHSTRDARNPGINGRSAAMQQSGAHSRWH